MEEVKKQGMESLFVPYEIALALKELGFDEPCLLRIQYSSGTDIFTGRKFKNSIWLGNGYDAEISDKKIKYKFPKHSEQGYGTLEIPTFSQAFRWFREKYGLVIEPCVPFQRLYSTEDDHFEILEFGYRIYSFDQYRGGLRDKIEWDGYDNSNEEEAELECLKKLIEIVKQK